jgi:ribosomal protein S18 acetylase RimI-like enzyme
MLFSGTAAVDATHVAPVSSSGSAESLAANLNMPPTYRLVAADNAAHFAAARVLIEAYAARIEASGVDLGFQNFAAELDQLPSMYGPPSGCLLLASRDDEWVGCCALRRFSDEVCEMKRLFIKPSSRGAGLGRQLIERLLVTARAMGYRRMVLDTLEDMIAARAMYRSLGFRETKPYYFNPIAGVSYMELDLETAQYTAPRS